MVRQTKPHNCVFDRGSIVKTRYQQEIGGLMNAIYLQSASSILFPCFERNPLRRQETFDCCRFEIHDLTELPPVRTSGKHKTCSALVIGIQKDPRE